MKKQCTMQNAQCTIGEAAWEGPASSGPGLGDSTGAFQRRAVRDGRDGARPSPQAGIGAGRRWRVRWLACLTVVFAMAGMGVEGAVQRVPLEAGWNLVSWQVGGETTVEGWAAGLENPDVLRSVWGYDAAAGQWRTWQGGIPGWEGDLATVGPGRGWWVQVDEAVVWEGEGEPWEGAVSLVPGWNLAGFPGLEGTGLESLFGGAFDAVRQVWTFDAAGTKAFAGYDATALPKRRDVESVEPGRGYWVFAEEGIELAPEPEVMLVPDVDAAPLQDAVPYSGSDAAYSGRRVKWAGEEDTAGDLNGNGIVDDAWTQDTVHFPAGVDLSPVTIGNAGGGAMNWAIEENVPWLSIEGPDSGVVASAKAYTYLKADRTGLEPGTHVSSNVVVTAGGVEKRLTVKLDVATAAGDFKGYATAATVDGKAISLGKVDLGLSFFMESDRTDETRFRAVVDRETSLLFPKDVFMDGVFYSGNDFSLATTFTLPAADRNAPPYDTFGDGEGEYGDRDRNGDGVLDVGNPFPSPIRRGVTLRGTRVDENTLEGNYAETLQGLLPNDEKILIEGTFVLERRTFDPTRRSIYNEHNDESGLIGQSSEDGLVRTVVVEEAVKVQTALATLDVEFPDPASLTVTLESPSGTVATLHARGEATMASSWTLADFDGENGAGTWTLRIAWNASSGERGRFHSWTLDLGGIVTHSASGRVVDDATGKAMAGVPWALTGTTLIHQGATGEDGGFRIDGLTENDYRIVFLKPGWTNATVAKERFSLEDANLDLGTFRLCQETAGGGGAATNGLVPNAAGGGYCLLDCAFVGAGAGLGGTSSTDVGTWRLMEGHRDCAAFDIDRYPVGPDTFNPRAEDTDFFVQPDTPYYAVDKEPWDRYFDAWETDALRPDRFRMECTMGGFVFGEDAARAQGFYLQSGRREP